MKWYRFFKISFNILKLRQSLYRICFNRWLIHLIYPYIVFSKTWVYLYNLMILTWITVDFVRHYYRNIFIICLISTLWIILHKPFLGIYLAINPKLAILIDLWRSTNHNTMDGKQQRKCPCTVPTILIEDYHLYLAIRITNPTPLQEEQWIINHLTISKENKNSKSIEQWAVQEKIRISKRLKSSVWNGVYPNLMLNTTVFQFHILRNILEKKKGEINQKINTIKS